MRFGGYDLAAGDHAEQVEPVYVTRGLRAGDVGFPEHLRVRAIAVHEVVDQLARVA